MVTSIGSAALAQTTFTPVKKTQQEEEAAVAAQIDAVATENTASTGETETVSALSSATARLGDQLAAQSDAARVDRARAEMPPPPDGAPPPDGPPPAEEAESTGESSAAAPTGARPAGGGGGASATSETESTDYIAEADTNSDKKVSDEERAAYEKKLEQQAQDKSGAVQKAYGLGEDSEATVSATA